MAYLTFTWPVSNQTTGNTKFTPLEAVFDEGYRQIAANGMQRPLDSVNVDVGPFEMAEAQACYDMLRSVQGLPFQWTPLKPLPQTVQLWTCKDFSFRRYGGLIVGVNAQFIIFGMP